MKSFFLDRGRNSYCIVVGCFFVLVVRALLIQQPRERVC
eukprot:COSAG06_NODE_62960_length_263_cov_1.250000_1_plen_38_part_10